MLSIGLAVMCAAVGVSMIGIILPHLGSRVPLTFFLRMIGLAGVLVVGCTALYVVSFDGGGRLADSAADALLIAAPLVVGVSVTSPGSRRCRRVAALALILPATVGLNTLLLPDEISHVLRLPVVALACAIAAILAFTSATVPRRSAILIAASLAAFAAYSLARLLIALGPAAPSGAAQMLCSTTLCASIGTACVLLIGLAILLVRRAPCPTLTGGGASWTRVVLGDWRAGIRTYGLPTVLALVSEVRSAARDLDPSSVEVHHGVDVPLPAALPALSRVLRETYGWRPEDLALLRVAEPLARPARSLRAAVKVHARR